MLNSIFQEVDKMFPGKAFLTVNEVATLLGCSERVIYNWTKRSNPTKRPPRVIVGKSLRFPKGELVEWLMQEQCGSGAKI